MNTLRLRLFTLTLFGILLCLTIGCASAPTTPAHTYTLRPQPEPYVREEPIEYRLYLPPQYTPDREWPLFVGLHGFGGTAFDCLNNWQHYADQAGFVLLCPWLEDRYGGWNQDEKKITLHEIIRRVQDEVRVQPRVFVAGFSAGGHLTQRFAWAYPDSVAGAAVLSAVTYDQPAPQAKDIPFLVVIGDLDHPGGVEQVQQFTQDLQNAGFTVEQHILPNIGHQASDAARELTMAFFRRTMTR